MKVVSDVLHLSYLDKFGLRVTVEAGQALACLYSEARLYKGPGPANPAQSTATRSTGNISVWVQKVGHSNTRGIDLISFKLYHPRLYYIVDLSTSRSHAIICRLDLS